jgi:hypothetical protein
MLKSEINVYIECVEKKVREKISDNATKIITGELSPDLYKALCYQNKAYSICMELLHDAKQQYLEDH